MPISPTITTATIADYPLIRNMARFYWYELSRYCAFPLPMDGLYASTDFKNYFTDSNKKAFLIKAQEEFAGFVLIHQSGSGWMIGEFFILAKFQKSGIGTEIAYKIWNLFPGQWTLSVIPNNTPALNFWRKILNNFTLGKYTETIKIIDYDVHQPHRHIFTFNMPLIAA